jgi:1-pyrroline-5-carboxylate dehydrogenase
VIRVPDFDTALEVADGTRFGLTGGVFWCERERMELARRTFHVGNLYFNHKITAALMGVRTPIPRLAGQITCSISCR